MKKTTAYFILLLILSFCGLPAAFAENTEAGIDLAGDSHIQWTCGVPFEDPGFTATDKEGRDVTGDVLITGDVTCWKTGTYKLRYFYKDADGEKYNAFRTVEVVPAELPEEEVREKTIYLSFDDGPCANTARVLELLDAYDAKATFFIINLDMGYLDMISEIHDRGHSIGIHCTNHDYGMLYSSEEYFFEDFMKAQQLVYDKTGEYAKVSRFPGGSLTAYAHINRKVDGGFATIEQRLHDMGVRYYDWNIQLEGPGNTYRSAMEMYYIFTQGVPQYETPIVLQHDTLTFSVNALEQLLQWGVDNGYTFAALDNSVPEYYSR